MKVQIGFLDVFIFVIWINIQIGPAWGGFQNQAFHYVKLSKIETKTPGLVDILVWKPK